MSLKSDLILFAVKTVIGVRNFNEKSSLADNARGGKTPDWMARIGDTVKGWFTKGFNYLMSNFASILTGGLQNLYQYDWAKTDKMIWDDINAVNEGFAQQLGRMGASKLFRSTGLGMTKRAKMLWPTLDPVVLATMDEENSEELKQTIDAAMLAMKSGLARNALNITYMSGRWFMGLTPIVYTEPWSLAAALDKGVEWVTKYIPIVGKLLSGFKEQAEDDFFDMGYLIGNGVQSQYAMSRAAIRDSQGSKKIIKIYPDRDDRTVFTFATGTESELKQTIGNMMVSNSAMDGKSVGQIVQTSLDTSMKSTMGLRLLTVYFNMSESGGTTLPNGKRAPQKIMEIKNVKLNVDYDKIKATFKNITGGAVRVSAHLDDGHQIQGYFQSESDGKAYLRNVVTNICVANLVRFSHIPMHDNPKMRPQSGIFKPNSCTIQIRKETLDENKKKFITTDGKMYKMALKNRITLRGAKPAKIDAWILNPFADQMPN